MTQVIADIGVRHGLFTVRSTSRSHVGRVRAINEDRVFDDTAGGVWAVVDGMGGHSGGDLAAQQVVDHLRGAVAAAGTVTPLLIREALTAANTLINERNTRLGLDAGATAVAATLADEVLEIIWAGDSRAYRLGDENLEPLTRDHSVVQQLVDRGLLTPAMADVHPHANVVTRALGVDADLPLDTVSVRVMPGMEPRARFLLCSDGLSRSLRAEDSRPDLALDALADRMIANALRRDGTDNASLVLIEVERRR